ncbi:hypothetical protein AA313_de0201121 [Arthrobotrys entomopaga]|nr:hypothetical protein AA313_de0201121 [Arthrobotrys entomopaga]
MEYFTSPSVHEVAILSERSHYDYIIVGTGMGGGVLARYLANRTEELLGKTQTDEREPVPRCHILLIERGGLKFTTHCANTAGPDWYRTAGPSTTSDIVYNAVKSPVFTVTSRSHPYVGGPVHCIGGRSNLWGLFTPKIDDITLDKYFPKEITDYLTGTEKGYDKAYRLLCNDEQANIDRPYPLKGPIHQDTVNNIDRIISSLNNVRSEEEDAKSEGKRTLYSCDEFQVSPFGAEFAPREPEKALYQLPMGGFSTVNWLINKAFNKSETVNLLPNTQVMTVNEKLINGKRIIESLTVLDKQGNRVTIPTGGATVILSAGTIDTATIALRSGLGKKNENIGHGLTDHQIGGTRFECLSGPDVKRLGEQALRVQCYATLAQRTDPKPRTESPELNPTPKTERCLVCITINETSFLGRSEERLFPAIRIGMDKERVSAEEFDKQLDAVKRRGGGLPELTPTIQIPNRVDYSAYIPSMKALARAIGRALAQGDVWNDLSDIIGKSWPVENSDLEDDPGQQSSHEGISQQLRASHNNGGNSKPPVPRKSKEKSEEDPRFGFADFGVVAHEVGTMRMGIVGDNKRVVDTDLKVCGLENLYVCDLSVFPYSPAANPSLTLAALAQRLGEKLINETRAKEEAERERQRRERGGE